MYDVFTTYAIKRRIELYKECDFTIFPKKTNKLIKTKHSIRLLNKAGIYAIYCHNNEKYYIGSAFNFLKRLRCHSSDLFRNKHKNRYLQNVYNKYGKNSFQFIILYDMDTIPNIDADTAYLLYMEKYFIDLHKSSYLENGMNIQLDPKLPPAATKIWTEQDRINVGKRSWQVREDKKIPYDNLIELAKKQFNLSEIPNNTKIIQGNKKVFLVDDFNYDKVKDFHWLEDSRGYPIKENKKEGRILLANFILDTKKIIFFKNKIAQDCRINNIAFEAEYYKYIEKYKYIRFNKNKNSYLLTVAIGSKKTINVDYLKLAIYFRDCIIKYYDLDKSHIIYKNCPKLSFDEIRKINKIIKKYMKNSK